MVMAKHVACDVWPTSLPNVVFAFAVLAFAVLVSAVLAFAVLASVVLASASPAKVSGVTYRVSFSIAVLLPLKQMEQARCCYHKWQPGSSCTRLLFLRPRSFLLSCGHTQKGVAV